MVAGGDDLTPDERAHIAPYVTDPVGPVFALVNLPEAVKGALFARYSRSPDSLRRILFTEFLPDGGGAAPAPSPEVGADRAREFFQRVLTDYGDDSVAQLGGAHVAIEGVSNVLTKVIEWGRLASYLEQSTRYVPYDTRRNGRWKYVRPAGIAADPALLAEYERVLDDAFATYARLNAVVLDHLMATEAPDGDAAARRAQRARALDAVRGMLPAATTANLGVYASGQAWESLIIRLRAHPLVEAREVGDQVLEALRHVIPDFLTRVDREDRGERHGAYRRATDERAATIASLLTPTTGTDPGWGQTPGGDRPRVGENPAAMGHDPEWGQTPAGDRPRVGSVPGVGTDPGAGGVRLLEFDPDGEARVLAHALWPSSGMPLDEMRIRVLAISPTERSRMLAQWADGRADRRERPGRALEATAYLFEITCDYGAYRDLQRHRLVTLEAQPLGATLGWERSPDAEAAGVADEFARVHEASAALWRDLTGVVPNEAPYAVTMSHRIRFAIRMNAREAMHLIELRSQPQGHAAYRRVAQDMRTAIRDVAGHAALAALMHYTDMDGHGDRLAQERRTALRRGGS